MSIKNLVVPTIVGAVLVIYILLSCEGAGCGPVPPVHHAPIEEFLNLWSVG